MLGTETATPQITHRTYILTWETSARVVRLLSKSIVMKMSRTATATLLVNQGTQNRHREKSAVWLLLPCQCPSWYNSDTASQPRTTESTKRKECCVTVVALSMSFLMKMSRTAAATATLPVNQATQHRHREKSAVRLIALSMSILMRILGTATATSNTASQQQQWHCWSTKEHRIDVEKKVLCDCYHLVNVHPDEDVGDWNSNSDTAGQMRSTDLTQRGKKKAVAVCVLLSKSILRMMLETTTATVTMPACQWTQMWHYKYMFNLLLLCAGALCMEVCHTVWRKFHGFRKSYKLP